MPFILTLTGRTCAGKSTLEGKLRDVGFEPVISTTTRAPRLGEIDGNFYGVTQMEMFRALAGGPPVMVVEPEGLMQIKRYIQSQRQSWKVYSVFVDNPDRPQGESNNPGCII